MPETEESRYSSPPNTWDTPYIFVWNAIGFTPGSTLKNQTVYIDRPGGDFVLRRIAGFHNVLAPTGQYQVHMPGGWDYIHGDPEFISPGSDEITIIPEILIKETSNIKFDLYNLL